MLEAPANDIRPLVPERKNEQRPIDTKAHIFPWGPDRNYEITRIHRVQRKRDRDAAFFHLPPFRPTSYAITLYALLDLRRLSTHSPRIERASLAC